MTVTDGIGDQTSVSIASRFREEGIRGIGVLAAGFMGVFPVVLPIYMPGHFLPQLLVGTAITATYAIGYGLLAWPVVVWARATPDSIVVARVLWPAREFSWDVVELVEPRRKGAWWSLRIDGMRGRAFIPYGVADYDRFMEVVRRRARGGVDRRAS